VDRDIDFEDRVVQPQGHYVARQADITLATGDDLHFDLDDQGYGFDLGPSDGIGSQDYDIDLGLDFGDGPASVAPSVAGRVEDDSMSVEVGRDAPLSRDYRQSIDSHLLGRPDTDLDILSQKSREPSEQPFGAEMDLDFGPDMGMDIDLGLDFGDRPVEDREKTPGQTRSPSRACECYDCIV